MDKTDLGEIHEAVSHAVGPHRNPEWEGLADFPLWASTSKVGIIARTKYDLKTPPPTHLYYDFMQIILDMHE